MSALFQAAIAPGSHLFPFRTEQLSPVAPMVLHTRGRVGRRHFNYISGGFLKPDFGNPPFFVSLCRSSGRPSGGGPPVFLALFRLCFSEWGCCSCFARIVFPASASGGSRQCRPIRGDGGAFRFLSFRVSSQSFLYSILPNLSFTVYYPIYPLSRHPRSFPFP